MVNAAIHALICSRFGEDAWDKIKARAGVQIEEFSRMSQYPDEVTYALVHAASEVLDLPPDDVMTAFGEFWVLYTGQVGYGHLFEMAGRSLREFLFNLDNLHSRVGQNFKDLVPPSFTFDDVSADTLRMHYHSHRAGLCPVVIGLLHGLATRFNSALAVEHPICARKGADHDLALGVGIAQGYATIGAIGFEGRWDYGAIGTVTNLAARLCGEARGWQILVTSRIASAVEDVVETEEVGALALKGLLKPVPAFNVVGLKVRA
jgi:hypothetical protein